MVGIGIKGTNDGLEDAHVFGNDIVVAVTAIDGLSGGGEDEIVFLLPRPNS